jgi:hypothetical protein
MNGLARISLGIGFAAALGLAPIVGCGGPGDDLSSSDQALAAQRAKNKKAMKACGLDDGSMDPDDSLRACDPGSTKKTTICHVPPGNPANAHTICIGNPAVGPHVHHHGDYMGPCKAETMCPPPGPGDDPGNHGGGGKGGGEDPPAPPAMGGSTGSGGSMMPPTPPPPSQCEAGHAVCSSNDGCAANETCMNGCCWRSVE